MLEKLVLLYLADSVGLFEDLCKAVASGDAKGIQKSAHPLKSNSASLGAMQLSELFKELELMGRENNTENAAQVLVATECAYSEACKALRGEIGQDVG